MHTVGFTGAAVEYVSRHMFLFLTYICLVWAAYHLYPLYGAELFFRVQHFVNVLPALLCYSL